MTTVRECGCGEMKEVQEGRRGKAQGRGCPGSGKADAEQGCAEPLVFPLGLGRRLSLTNENRSWNFSRYMKLFPLWAVSPWEREDKSWVSHQCIFLAGFSYQFTKAAPSLLSRPPSQHSLFGLLWDLNCVFVAQLLDNLSNVYLQVRLPVWVLVLYNCYLQSTTTSRSLLQTQYVKSKLGMTPFPAHSVSVMDITNPILRLNFEVIFTPRDPLPIIIHNLHKQ